MHAPSGFKRWRFHWFECPACGHRSHRAYSNVSMTRRPLRIVQRFWCERCGAYATLRDPRMPNVMAALMLVFIGPLSLVFVWRAMLAGMRFEWLILIFAAFWVAQPLVLLGVTRVMYRYVPAT